MTEVRESVIDWYSLGALTNAEGALAANSPTLGPYQSGYGS